MDHSQLFISVISGIIILLILILYFKIHAFTALFITSITVALLAGMQVISIIPTLQKGMGDTLGFVATVVGFGSIFGAILEHSGGANALVEYILHKTGERYAPYAMALTGFIVAIPVFFDVAFIILFPMVFALHKKTGKSILIYGLPLLAGLAVSHSFIPPTPGPVAVAEIIGADMGWVIITGIIAGLPASLLIGPYFAQFISKKIVVLTPSPESDEIKDKMLPLPSAFLIISIIALPILLIVLDSIISSPLSAPLQLSQSFKDGLHLVGHPFSALIIANLVAWYFLGIKKGFSKNELLEITNKSLAPAGLIILITGAGGVFKQVLSEIGAGKALATSLNTSGVSYLVFAFLIAAIVRILQGSATVAMITSAGMIASLIPEFHLTSLEKALIVTSIASGATVASHVNDSGFWLVSRYFGMNEKQTLSSWTVLTTLISFSGLGMVLIIKWIFVNN